MKKSTKLITTAVAMVLVVAAMVVGIYAATSASATIGATVSWSATEGLQFTIGAYTVGSKEHQEYLTSKGKTFADFDALDVFNYHGYTENVTNYQQLISVNTLMSNDDADGLSGRIDANFVDTSDDGVNNPRDIYYVYYISNTGHYNYSLQYGLKVIIDSVPQTTENIEVSYWANIVAGDNHCRPSEWATKSTTTPPTQIIMNKDNTTDGQSCLIIRLRLLTPNESLTDFDASISLSFERYMPSYS